MKENIAIVGLGCRYPDARSPRQLWENVLAQRQAFRRMPDERMRLEDYHSSNRQAPDRTYGAQAAVLEGYEFERVKFRVAGRTFRSADLTHWLALDIAARALADAGFPEGEGLDKDATGVLVGNSLTGEFSRSHLMRLRWPYVRRVLTAALLQEGWSEEKSARFVERLEPSYKSPFPPISEESLAGGLSNTIAGRISNQFDLHGGGYTVDGACASSLLAVANACTLLASGEMEVVLAGGVDLSLDPFELIGFAKTNALAAGAMRVYDADSDGFIPGEGCGFAVLMSERRARAECRHIYALIRGWGISSDGSGGITRPESSGQRLALERAYRRAGVGIDSVSYFEGHGTGTAVGDATELKTLIDLRLSAGAGQQAALGSIKANIGHTKAAAGIAGLIKAVLALENRLLPPHTGWQKPHPLLNGQSPLLRLLPRAEPWPERMPLRAAVSAMGFGGINTHLLLEGAASNRRRSPSASTAAMIRSRQDAEVFLMADRDADGLSRQVERVRSYASRISLAEMADLAARLEKDLQPGRLRAALVASTPAQLSERLGTLAFWLHQGLSTKLDIRSGVFLGSAGQPPRIGFLFSGQGAPSNTSGGAWRHRFEAVEDLYQSAQLPCGTEGVATEVAQPAIVTSSMAGLRVLDEWGIEASRAVGHSLGELSALHWAGAFDEKQLLAIAQVRGQAMAQLEGPSGGMVSVGASPAALQGLLEGLPLQVASLNGPEDTVVSGQREACEELVERAHTAGLRATRLQVSHAFHSPLVAGAAPSLADFLARIKPAKLSRQVISTVTGTALDEGCDLSAVLVDQVTSPVLFANAVEEAGRDLDLWIEVGPGGLLSGLVRRFQKAPALSLDAGGETLSGLLQVAAAAFALGAPLRSPALFDGRLTRPFDLDWRPSFLANPCEEAPQVFDSREPQETAEERLGTDGEEGAEQEHDGSITDLVRRLIAKRTELPLEAVREESLLLGDLHLNSISVSELVSAAARRIDIDPPAAPTEYANATVAQVAEALRELRALGKGRSDGAEGGPVEGLQAWVRPFWVDLVEEPWQAAAPPSAPGSSGRLHWHIVAPQDHPLRARLGAALESASFAAQGARSEMGLALCLPPEAGADEVDLLLEAARLAFGSGSRPSRFMLLQQGGGGGGFARTLHLESSGLVSLVADLPFDHPQAVEWALQEMRSASGYVEVHYDRQGCRRVPRLRLLELGDAQAAHQPPLGSQDVLLVSGGGKGIAAESALALARRWGVRLLLLGRSDPEHDEELASNLKRLEAYQVKFSYCQSDVSKPEELGRALQMAVSQFGEVTALLHGAGFNRPRPLSVISRRDFERTLAPKLQGLENLLQAIDPNRLKALVTFGSIIARSGMAGEADYAAANEWLARRTERFAEEHPSCRCLCLEWSVWSGIGMGERLGRLDALMRQGITPIPPEEGVDWLIRLLNAPQDSISSSSVVVTGRFGESPTLGLKPAELPLQRFLEYPRHHIPGVELIADTELSSDSDPYLAEHALRGERLFPAVMGLEAMAQVAGAVLGCNTGKDGRLVFEQVEFHRPVVVPAGEKIRIRVASLVRGRDRADAVLRCESSGFKVDHFQARCRFEPASAQPAPVGALFWPPNGSGPLPLDPVADLYENILFHQGRFRRLKQYWNLRATECTAELAPDGKAEWFGHYLPRGLMLGDPGARDAAIHAIQACIPHATILPLGVERIESRALGEEAVFMSACERSRDGDTLVYDLEITDAEGRIAERWTGLKLRIVHRSHPSADWAVPLLGAHFERRLQELIPGSDVRVILEKASGQRPERTDRVIARLVNGTSALLRRPDGKPELANGEKVSVSHAGDLVLAVTAAGRQVGCDLEPVEDRTPESWSDLLGPERLQLSRIISEKRHEDLHTSATRIWATMESLKKAGALANSPLTLKAATRDGWVVLGSGQSLVGTLVAKIRENRHPFALTVVLESRTKRERTSHEKAEA